MTEHLESKLRILIASGVNMDLLGQREPEVYGHSTLADVHDMCQATVRLNGFAEHVELSFFQSNHEGLFLDKLSEGWDGLLVNPGAWTHTSLALADRLAGLQLPFVEVHMSNVSARESIRHKSLTAPHAKGVVYGFGVKSYSIGLRALIEDLMLQVSA